jgi:hypothetical protein
LAASNFFFSSSFFLAAFNFFFSSAFFLAASNFFFSSAFFLASSAFFFSSAFFSYDANKLLKYFLILKPFVLSFLACCSFCVFSVLGFAFTSLSSFSFRRTSYNA